MHHLLEHINHDIRMRQSKDKDSTVHKTEYWSKKIQQVNPGGPDKQPKHQAPTISSIDKSEPSYLLKLNPNCSRPMFKSKSEHSTKSIFLCVLGTKSSMVN